MPTAHPREDGAPSAVLPADRGPASATALRLLTAPDPAEVASSGADTDPGRSSIDPLVDPDLQLALALLYEPHYADLPGVAPGREWDPAVLGFRRRLEARHEDAVRELAAGVLAAASDAPACGTHPAELTEPADRADEVVATLEALTAHERPGPLALFLGRDATREQFRDHLAQRATYHLRESDPQTFALARIDGPAKAAFAALQFDEFGAGRGERVHADLYAAACASLDLSTRVVDHLATAEPAVLAVANTMSLFGLHRRLRGAAVGHLAAFEATSAVPCRLIALGAVRLGLPPQVAHYYEEHVEADSVHEQVAVHDIAGALVRTAPDLADDVLLGAAACLALDEAAATALLARASRAPTRPDEAA